MVIWSSSQKRKRAAATRSAREGPMSASASGRRALPGELHKSAKAIGIVDGDVGEHLAVHLDAGLAEAVDQLRVRHALLARGRVDPRDPEAAEVALAVAPVAVRVGIR